MRGAGGQVPKPPWLSWVEKSLWFPWRKNDPSRLQCLLWHERERALSGWRPGRELPSVCFARCARWIDTHAVNSREGGACAGGPGIVSICKKPTLFKNDLSLWTMVRCYPWNLLLTVTMVAESEPNFPHLHWGSYLYNSVLESKSFLFLFFLTLPAAAAFATK